MPAAKNSSHAFLKVVVIGAGPAGLAAAAALAQDGHTVTVLERHRKLQTRGGNLIVQYPAVKCLNHIGVTDKELDQVSFQTDGMNFWSYKADKPFATTPNPPDVVPRRLTERPAVQRLAYGAALKNGADILFNKRIVSISEKDDQVTVTADDGTSYMGDLLIGADGIKSVTRRLMFPDIDTAAVTTAECTFQTEVKRSDVLSDPVAAPLGVPTHHLIFGPGLYCIGRPTASGTMRMLLCCFNYGRPDRGDDHIDGQWNSDGDPEEIRKIFNCFSAPLKAYFECVVRGGIPIDKWRLATAPPLKTWRGFNGRGIIMGDAAHAMVPHVAQGISQGIEDGIALAIVLRNATSKEDVPSLLQNWEELRKPRAEIMMSTSTDNANRFSLPDGPEQEARDEMIKKGGFMGEVDDWDKIEMDPSADHGTAPFSKWMMFYDVVEQTNDYMQKKLSAAK